MLKFMIIIVPASYYVSSRSSKGSKKEDAKQSEDFKINQQINALICILFIHV